MPLAPLLIAASTLLPGLWEYQSSLVGSRSAPEQKCLTSAEVERFLTNPSNRHYDCTYSTHEVGGGRVKLDGVCANRKRPEQKIGVTLAGAYTPTTITLKGAAKPRFAGLELPLSAAITGHRLSATCDAPPAPARSGHLARRRPGIAKRRAERLRRRRRLVVRGRLAHHG